MDTTTLTLNSSGLAWDTEALCARYAFLRKRREEVRLDLLYYPYRLFHLRGQASWRFFGKRPLEMLLVVDARTGKCLRVSSFPEVCEERIVFEHGNAAPEFSPARVEADGQALEASAHVAAAVLDEAEAASKAEAFAIAAWRRRCNLPLGPRADIRCSESSSRLLCKPFWIMRPKERPAEGKMFVFDATTGLGGVSEYWNVVEYVLGMERREAS